MLKVDPDSRASAEDILKSRWFKYDNAKTFAVPIDKAIYLKLKKYKSESFLKKTVMNILIKMSHEWEVIKMMEQF